MRLFWAFVVVFLVVVIVLYHKLKISNNNGWMKPAVALA